MNVTAQDVISILSIFATIVISLRSYFWSRDYKEAKQAQLDAKDDQIKLLEKESSPHLREAYDSMKIMLEVRIGQLNTEVDELNREVDNLTEQLIEEKLRRNHLELELAGMKISQTARSVINAYTAGSRAAIEQIEESVDVLSSVGENIQRKAEEIIKATVLEITPPPTESITGTDIANVEITGPDSDESVDDNGNDDKPSDTEDEITKSVL